VLGAAAEARLLAAGVGTAPPSLEALAGLGGRAGGQQGIRPEVAGWPAVRDADLVFLALHGGQGEDGTLQALFDLAGVRYTGSGHLASALAMDQHLSKVLFRAAGVRTADWRMAPPLTAGDADARARFRDEAVAALGLPVIVKPSRQGSSVALTVVREAEALWPAVDLAFHYDSAVMVEQFVAGRELSTPLLGDRVLPTIEIVPAHEVYDYECKYTPGMADEHVAQLTDAEREDVERQARLAYAALGLAGCARVDFRLTAGGEAYCLEANTLPGMTELSLVPQGAAAAGLLFADLCVRIVELAMAGDGAPAGHGLAGETPVNGS
jgi:D-alanine-D-alanine ligase